MKQEQKFDLFKSVLIALVSGLTVVFFQQIFFRDNVDYEMKRSILKDNYEYYVALQNFSDIGYYTLIRYEQVVGQPKITVYIDKETNETLETDTSFVYKNKTLEEIEIPSIAIDSMRQVRWEKEKNFIIKNKDKIDQDIYLSFLEIVRIVEKNPFPQSTEIPVLKKSVWTSEKFINNWELRNMSLWSDVDELITIK